MSRSTVRAPEPPRLHAALLAAAVLAATLLVPSIASAAPVPGAAAVPQTAATPSQWAFGGSATSSFSCSSSTCFGGNLTMNSTFSVSWRYYLEWVVIYTEINVSSTQTELEAKAALNISLSLDYSACTVVTTGQPCQTSSIVGSLSGRQTTLGSTNLTNGTVDLVAGPGSPAFVAARAVTNASAHQAFNISGKFSFVSPSSSTSSSGVVGFVLGGSETSSLTFSTPLGLVPIDPVAGDAWTSSAPYAASGSWAGGYSYTLAASGSSPVTINNWTHGSVAPSGILTVNGSAVGAQALWDNYTTPASQSSAERIVLEFSGANVSGTDGWILAGTDLFRSLVAGASGMTNVTSSSVSSESAFYAGGKGFVGASLGGNASNVSGVSGAPDVTVRAGPEPTSVAEQQYLAMTAGASSPKGFPYLLVLVVVVAAAVAVVGVLLWRRSVRRRRPPVAAPASADALPPPPQPPTLAP